MCDLGGKQKHLFFQAFSSGSGGGRGPMSLMSEGRTNPPPPTFFLASDELAAGLCLIQTERHV